MNVGKCENAHLSGIKIPSFLHLKRMMNDVPPGQVRDGVYFYSTKKKNSSFWQLRKVPGQVTHQWVTRRWVTKSVPALKMRGVHLQAAWNPCLRLPGDGWLILDWPVSACNRPRHVQSLQNRWGIQFFARFSHG